MTLRFLFYAFFLGIALPGCSQPALPAPGGPQSENVKRSAASGYALLYSFKARPDGAHPAAGLLPLSGGLYGTTQGGGSGCGTYGCGTVFTISTAGRERVVTSFAGGSAGSAPEAAVIAMGGALYGTTFAGGSGGNGTIFETSTSGKKRVLTSFNGTFGALPVASLTALDGTLYGTTYAGDASNGGAVFAANASGAEQIVYGFKRGTADGANPAAGVIAENGALYGTTYYGGSSGSGTVYSISVSGLTFGARTIVYSFKYGTDGANPAAGLIEQNGVFYGTTLAGGTANRGTVFAVSGPGVESMLYSFKGGSDGASPKAGLTALNGAFYGVTSAGGTNGMGTVFEIGATGSERVLYSFKGRPDGATPVGALVALNGKLYGTTYSGGANGNGTVFAITP